MSNPTKAHWKAKIDEIESFFKSNGIPDGPIQLYPWLKISDPKKCIEAGVLTVRTNLGNEVYAPYMIRLLDLMKLIKTNEVPRGQ